MSNSYTTLKVSTEKDFKISFAVIRYMPLYQNYKICQKSKYIYYRNTIFGIQKVLQVSKRCTEKNS